jgi:hypothetical protein
MLKLLPITKNKTSLKPQKTPNIPNQSFLEQDPWYGHQMYICGPNNPKSTHVEGCQV